MWVGSPKVLPFNVFVFIFSPSHCPGWSVETALQAELHCRKELGTDSPEVCMCTDVYKNKLHSLMHRDWHRLTTGTWCTQCVSIWKAGAKRNDFTQQRCSLCCTEEIQTKGGRLFTSRKYFGLFRLLKTEPAAHAIPLIGIFVNQIIFCRFTLEKHLLEYVFHTNLSPCSKFSFFFCITA